MVFDFGISKKVRVSMPAFVDSILDDFRVNGPKKSPSDKSLFEVDKESETLNQRERENFHSMVAKILYLGKRCRPDILAVVSFLTTRVMAPTRQDLKKLERAIAYLKGTKALGIVLECGEDPEIIAHIDASYGVHADMRSHTGVVISMGKGPIYCESTRQTLVTKSSTEAELVGLSTGVSTVIWARDFLIEQGYLTGPATVYQDNTGAISLAKNGRASSKRSRHISIRFFFVKDRIQSGELFVTHCESRVMTADILTKGISGEGFLRLRELLMNDSEDRKENRGSA
jgi:hypothetical protein